MLLFVFILGVLGEAVDGNWSPWSPWSQCDVTCENGTESRVRYCNNPPPPYGGLGCSGDGIELKTCQRQLCPVHGGWSDWAPWGTCPVTCGIGMMSRTRSCTNPVPDRFGNHCFGNILENALCSSGPCRVDGNWSPWSPWSQCDVTCENGTESRVRYCNNPPPQNGGLGCSGDGIELETCKRQLCPVHGGWSDWAPWGTCPETCGIGMMSRTRSCTNPIPDRFGNHCFGNSQESALCNSGPCGIKGGWSDWEQWGKCSVICGVGMQSRRRSCNNPTPKGNGNTCSGRDLDVKLCNPGFCSPTDCYDVHKKQNATKSGIYDVTLWRSKHATQVYCDMETDNGGWTVFQYRFNGSVDFYRRFSEYERGFGDFVTEYWLGLSIVQEMTAQSKSELRLELTASDGTTSFEIFQNFFLGPSPYYRLYIDRGTGTAGDSLTYHNGNAFTTYDIDRDQLSSLNCATAAHGAWWYVGCYYSNLNGKYVTPGSNDVKGMTYRHFKEFHSLKTSKMMFRRV